MVGVEWVDTILPMRPYWFVRTLAGISMDIGMTLLVVNMVMTARQRTVEAARPAPRDAHGAVLAGGAE
jgi:cytochrome c oxidase cbb3-type subunit 1